LFEPREYPIKVILLAVYSLMMWALFSIGFQPQLWSETNNTREKSKADQDDRLNEQERPMKLLGNGEIVYLVGLILVEVYGQFLHKAVFKEALPFLPLMMTSVYCALGMLYMWMKQFMYMCNFE
jgi:alpha-1,3-glucosyltransferase